MQTEDIQKSDLEACDRALCELLDAITAYDRDEAAQARRRSLAQAVPDDDRDFDRMTFRTLVTDPVRSSMRSGLKTLGREIHRLGGLDAMQASLDTAASADDANYGRRAGILDSAWNGIGDGSAKWWS